jgi:hypothetical protein
MCNKGNLKVWTEFIRAGIRLSGALLSNNNEFLASKTVKGVIEGLSDNEVLKNDVASRNQLSIFINHEIFFFIFTCLTSSNFIRKYVAFKYN